MQNDKQQTAVEFLEQEYYYNFENLIRKDFEKAKELEKQNLINMAYLLAINISKDAKDQLTPEELYTENYGK